MRYGRIAVVAAVLLVFLAGGFFFALERTIAPYGNPVPSPAAGYSANINGHEVALETATTVPEQQKGLSGRSALAPDHGMLFIFPSAGNYGFWMKDMQFSIDIVWLRDGRVLGWENAVDPQFGAPDALLRSYYPPSPADQVLELPAGSAARYGMSVGMQIVLSKG